jgi:hypothetical protein
MMHIVIKSPKHFNANPLQTGIISSQKKITILIGLQLFILSAFKATTVGVDMKTYITGFYTIASLNWEDLGTFSWEYGYVLLNKLVSLLSEDVRFLIIIVSLIVIVILGKQIYINSRNQWLSFYLFVCMDFYSFTLSGYRQSIAMVITFYSIKYLRQRLFFRFTLCVIIASFFHQAALVFLLIYPISKIKITKEYLFCTSIIALVMYFLGGPITNFLLSLYDRRQIVIQGQGLGMFLLLLIITISGLLFLSYSKKEDNTISIYTHIMIWAVVLQILSFHLSIFVRVVSYLSINMIIFIPNIIAALPSKKHRILGTIVVCILAFGFYIYTLSGNPSGTVPYKFMWQKMIIIW